MLPFQQSGPGSWIGPLRRGMRDIADGARRYALWGTIGLQEVRQRYRRSVLGPFWITLSMGIMIAAMGLLYGAIFRQDMHEYLPYLTAGFVTWNLIATLLVDGSQSFIVAERLMRQLSAPVSVYAYRVVWSGLITFLHNIWIFFLVALWFQRPVGWEVLLVIPAVAVLLVNGLWMGLLFGTLSSRFRDVPLIVASVVQVMFFITPVIWQPSMLPGRALLLDLNPFYYLLEILRAPLLGQVPSLTTWLAALFITAAGWGVALFFYASYRWRIAYWV